MGEATTPAKNDRCLLSGDIHLTKDVSGHTRLSSCDIPRRVHPAWTRRSPRTPPAAEGAHACRLIVESIQREGSLKPAAAACAPSEHRAAPAPTVRVASELHVHVCFLVCTCTAAKKREKKTPRDTERQRRKWREKNVLRVVCA